MRRTISTALIRSGGYLLHRSPLQRLTRAVLDEIDLQALKNGAASLPDRTALFTHVQRTVIGDEPITYLEFGVHEGASMREWLNLNRHPESRFVGFDSFEGLPHDWRDGQAAGHFHVGGNPPDIPDSRVSWVKGWFDQTVPSFARSFVPQYRLVVHCDADLYSSTMTALVHLTPFLRSGSLLLFDEFYDRDHEFKAFRDWQAMSGKRASLIAEIGHCAKVCARVD